MFDARDIATLLSLLSGSATLLYGIVQSLRSAARVRAATAALREQEAERAISSNDLNILGSFLYEGLGEITIDNYVRDATVQRRVDAVTRRVSDFLTPEGVGDDSKGAVTASTTPHEERGMSSLAKKHGLDGAEIQIRSGQIWNGLAELRRVVELKFRAIALRHGLKAEKLSAGRLLRELARDELIPEQSVAFFDLAIKVANRGVHGLDVPSFEALGAVNAAAQGLEIVDVLGPRSN